MKLQIWPCLRFSYLEFIDQSANLNDLTNYPQLVARCKAIGFQVSTIVFRGYKASPVLQQMHDDTIMARNKLKIAVRFHEFEYFSNSLIELRIWRSCF